MHGGSLPRLSAKYQECLEYYYLFENELIFDQAKTH